MTGVPKSHVAIDGGVRRELADTHEKSAGTVLYSVDAWEFLSSPYGRAVADNRLDHYIVEFFENYVRHPSERFEFGD